jgi:hypothetical protein
MKAIFEKIVFDATLLPQPTPLFEKPVGEQFCPCTVQGSMLGDET